MFSGHPNIRNALYLQPPHHPCGGFFVGMQNPGGARNSAWILSPGRNERRRRPNRRSFGLILQKRR